MALMRSSKRRDGATMSLFQGDARCTLPLTGDAVLWGTSLHGHRCTSSLLTSTGKEPGYSLLPTGHPESRSPPAPHTASLFAEQLWEMCCFPSRHLDFRNPHAVQSRRGKETGPFPDHGEPEWGPAPFVSREATPQLAQDLGSQGWKTKRSRVGEFWGCGAELPKLPGPMVSPTAGSGMLPSQARV